LMHPRPGLEATYATSIARTTSLLGDPWDSWLGRLVGYRDDKGNIDIGVNWEQAAPMHRCQNKPEIGCWRGHELGNWCRRQRVRFRRNFLDERKVARLRALGFRFRLRHSLFEQGLAELKQYIAEKKTRKVPVQYAMPSGFPLGLWWFKEQWKIRRRKMPMKQVLRLQDVFHEVVEPDEREYIFEHSDDPEVGELTKDLETELRLMRWQDPIERRRFYRSLLLRHHPDVSDSPHAGEAIQFLARAKEWFFSNDREPTEKLKTPQRSRN